jgi:hypothetical protein
MAKRKVRKFADGGLSSAQEEWLGGADRTDPYILARMRSAVPDEAAPTSRDFDTIDSSMAAPSRDLTAPVTKTVTKTSVTATPKPSATPKPTPETPEQYSNRMKELQSKDALINVSPEDYVTPGGFLKGMLKRVVSNGAKNALKTYTAREMAEMAPKMIGKESLKLGSEVPKLGMKKGGSVKSKSISSGGKVKKMSSGGKVKSASARADGCAIRGKTKA